MATKKIVRGLLFTMKMNEPEKNILEKVAEVRGLSNAMLIRMLVADEARRLGIEQS